MASKLRSCLVFVSAVAAQLMLPSCASDAAERKAAPAATPPQHIADPEPPRWQPGPETFEVGCAFGITGCEAGASERCGYAGFHVLGSYKTQGAFGTPYYYMQAACGPAPRNESAFPPVPGARPNPFGRAPSLGASPAAPDARPNPFAQKPSSGPWSSGAPGAEDPLAFEVECRFAISSCESQVSQRCRYGGYHVLGSYQVQGAFGSPYFYMKAACGPAPVAKTEPGADAPLPALESQLASSRSAAGEEWADAWEAPRLEMVPPADSASKSDGKAQGDPSGGAQATDSEAPKSLEAQAQGGNREAEVRLAARYAAGVGVPRDPVRASEWYQKAAEQGDATAQNNLAVLYDRGHGVRKDLVKAASWYRKAAEQGAAVAQYNLALIYRLGIGVPKDDEQVASWLKKAAAQGQPNAQGLVGILYLRGEGEAKDDVLAYAWLNLAAAQGNEKAAKTRDEIRLSPQGIAEAQRLSSRWKKGQGLRRLGADKRDKTHKG